MFTILTDPLPYGKFFLSEIIRIIYRIFRDFLARPKYNYGKYRGHFAVTRSLIEGLKKNNLSFNYNPICLSQVSDYVVVLAGIRTLKLAIELKRKGFVKKIFAGPNIMIFASDCDFLLASKEIDFVITPSQEISDLYLLDIPSLKNRIFVWPAGVNTEYWKPSNNLNRNKILIFEKQNKGPVGPIEPYFFYLKSKGYLVEVLKYGEFTHSQFLSLLQQSCLLVGFVTDESQGIAWAEAWSSNVPTLIWKNSQNKLNGRIYNCSTAPYLNKFNGLFFNNLEHFKIQFSYWEENQSLFTPREWVLNNLSDEVCSEHLFNFVISC